MLLCKVHQIVRSYFENIKDIFIKFTYFEIVQLNIIIAFESEEANVQLAAVSEEERGSWIERLHIASYECMKMQLQSLREQIQARTGRDPIDSPEPSTLPEYNPGK